MDDVGGNHLAAWAARCGALGAGLAVVLVAGCGGGGHVAASSPRARAPRLADPRPCPGAPGFTCSSLAVPLDHAGRAAGALRLNVAVAGEASAPLGTLVFLTGGPGQPGVPFATRIRGRLGPSASRLRLVLLDQRGTGAGALGCPALQAAVGTSDLTVPSPGAVDSCARRLGDGRRFYATAATVADLEDLRRALGVARVTLDGVSYGSFVAERYAIAHPGRVARLVLDSVVPAAGLDGLEVDAARASAGALRAACRAQRCPTDPGADLAAVVRRDPQRGPAVLDTLVALSVGAPSFPGVPAALHAARGGRPAALDRLVAAVRRAQAAPPALFSAGLHAATLCADLRAPWGGPDAPVADRAAAVARAAARTDPAPFDRPTIRANGLLATCERWPPTRAPSPPGSGTLPARARAAPRRGPRPLNAAGLGARPARAHVAGPARRRPRRRALGAGACRRGGRPAGAPGAPARAAVSAVRGRRGTLVNWPMPAERNRDPLIRRPARAEQMMRGPALRRPPTPTSPDPGIDPR